MTSRVNVSGKVKQINVDARYKPLDESWKNDERMSYLMAPFRLRTLNPYGYDGKMKFWKELIKKYCEISKGCAVVSLLELNSVFIRADKKTHCIRDVLDDMLKNGEIIDEYSFLNEDNKSWADWAFDLTAWGINKLKDITVGSPAINPATKFVVLDTIKHQSTYLMELLDDQTESILSLEDVYKIIESKSTQLPLNTDGVMLVLQQLKRDNLIYITEVTDFNNKTTLLIKIASKTGLEPITDIDKSVYNLVNTEKCLLATVDNLETSIKDCDEKARSFIKIGKRQMAKNWLKKKHAFNRKLDHHIKALDNIQELLSRVQNTGSDMLILDAYKMGANALKKALESSGLSVDAVDDTIADVQEALEDYNEVQNAMGQEINMPGEDESQLEAELAELIEESFESNVKLPETPNDKKLLPSVDTDEIEERLNKLVIPPENIDVDSDDEYEKELRG